MTRKVSEAVKVEDFRQESSHGSQDTKATNSGTKVYEPATYSTNKVAKLINAKESTVRQIWAPKLVEAYNHAPNPIRIPTGVTGDGLTLYVWTEDGLKAFQDYKAAMDCGMGPEHLAKIKELYQPLEQSEEQQQPDDTLEAEILDEVVPVPTNSSLATTNQSLKDRLQAKLKAVKTKTQAMESELQQLDEMDNDLEESRRLFDQLQIEEHRQKCIEKELKLRKVELEVKATTVLGNDLVDGGSSAG